MKIKIKKNPTPVSMRLTKQEASVLCAVCGNIAGVNKQVRTVTDEIYDRLLCDVFDGNTKMAESQTLDFATLRLRPFSEEGNE